MRGEKLSEFEFAPRDRVIIHNETHPHYGRVAVIVAGRLEDDEPYFWLADESQTRILPPIVRGSDLRHEEIEQLLEPVLGGES